MELNELLTRWGTDEGKPYKGSLIDMASYEPGNLSCMCAQGQALHLIGGWSPEQLRDTAQSEADLATAKLLNISRAHAVLLRSVNDTQDGAPAIVLTHPEKIIGDNARTVLAFWLALDGFTADQWDAAGDAAWDAARAAAWDAAGDAARAAAWNAAWNAAGDAVRAAAWDAAGAAAWNAAWDAVRAAAWDAAGDAARAAAWNAAWDAAGDAARDAAGDAAGDAARAAAGDAAGAAARAAAWDAAGAAVRAAAWASNEIQGVSLMRERGQPFYFLPLFGFANPEAIPPLPADYGVPA